jgi:hypothetical protein
MSIQAEIASRVAEGRLRALEQAMPSTPEKRRILVAEQDTFVATNWLYREEFRDPATQQDDSRKWRDEVVRCKTIWSQLFPSYNPFVGNTLHDFISNARLPI